MNKRLITASILIVFSLLIIGLVYFKVLDNPLVKSNAVLSVTASYEQASVILDGSLVGKTPYEGKTLKPGEHIISLKSDSGSYEAKVTLISQATTVISREVGTGGSFSSGYSVWMEKISNSETSLSIVSSPTGSSVTIDDEEKGTTPLNIPDLSEGEHTITISKPGYEPQSLYLRFKKGFKLNVNADMFLYPIPENLESIPYSDKIKIYNLALSESSITVEPSVWAKAVAYFVKTRGRPITFNYFLDYNGVLYDISGLKVTLSADSINSENITIGYLGQNKGDLSDKATEALAVFGGAAAQGTAKIIPTGVGWLRVRSEPSLEGTEIARVNVGEEFKILGEEGDWIKIKIDETTEGWVSSAYVQKSAQ